MTHSTEDVVKALERAIRENERMIRAGACATDHRESLCVADLATLRELREALAKGPLKRINLTNDSGDVVGHLSIPYGVHVYALTTKDLPEQSDATKTN